MDTLTAQACAQFADSVLPVLPMEGLAVVLLDQEKETSRVVFSLGDPHPRGYSPGCGRGAEALWGERDAPPMCIPLQGREGELGAVLYRTIVAVQDKCPVKWPAEMSLGQAAMVSDDDVEGPSQACRVGGLSAARYFLMVALWIPNSRSIALSDIPSRLAF